MSTERKRNEIESVLEGALEMVRSGDWMDIDNILILMSRYQEGDFKHGYVGSKMPITESVGLCELTKRYLMRRSEK